MKQRYIFIFLTIFLLPHLTFAQRNCSTMEVLDRLKAEDPALENRMEAIERHTERFVQEGTTTRAVVTIPVVVHVVYRTTTENISAAQIQSQIDVLNKDFQALNADLNSVPDIFQNVIGNAEIAFCLATRDPNGGTTTGITRTSSTRRSWGTNDNVKRASAGGVDPWDPARYLNIWVCNIGNNILGYAQFPGGSSATDGVVIDYRYFGTTGTAQSPFNGGRTATHEVGHWLNLRHIWGDATCGNDLVDDTPTHNAANTRCPSQPHLSTCAGNPVEMTMNYMDYTDDRCMYLFTLGQAARMRAVLAPGGARASLLNSDGCQAPDSGGGTTCAAPAGLNATNITASSAILSWNAVAGATGYNVRLRPVSASTWTTSSSTGTSINATSLTAGTNYEFQVQTICGSSTSATYTATNFTTTQASTPTCTDTYESNNTRSNAKPISVGSPIQALVGSSSDQDWFRFNITQRNLRVTLRNLPKDYDLQLYRGSSLIASSRNADTQDEQIVVSNTSTTSTYYLRVSGYNGAFDLANCYQLYVETASGAFRQPGIVLAEEVVVPDFNLYPNPADQTITLDIPVESEIATEITILDLAGKVVQRSSEALTKGNSRTTLNVHNLPSGVYVVRVQNGAFIANQKFVIHR